MESSHGERKHETRQKWLHRAEEWNLLRLRSDSHDSYNIVYETLRLSFGSSVIAAGVSFVPSPAKRDKVVYTGAATRLNAGSVVYVRMRGTCLLRYIGGKEQFLGGFYLGHSCGCSRCG